MTKEGNEVLVGTILDGKYKLTRLLGEGGMGAVFEAQNLRIKKRVAIKFLHAEMAKRGDLRARFEREALAAGSLHHENIAGVFDVGQHGDIPFLVMEFLEGRPLANLIKQEAPLPLSRAASLLIQACRGLSVVHKAGIVHRDLKPDNLFLCQRADGGDLLKVLDFGIAKMDDEGEAQNLTKTNQVMGTPAYLAPEQARGAKLTSPRTDIHALGVIFFEMLSGRRPFEGDNVNAVVVSIAVDPPPSVRATRQEIPSEIDAILARAMAKIPEDRFSSTEELGLALSPFIEPSEAPRLSSPLADSTRTSVPSELVSTPSALVSSQLSTPGLTSEPGAPKPRPSATRHALWAVPLILLGGGGILWSSSSPTAPALAPSVSAVLTSSVSAEASPVAVPPPAPCASVSSAPPAIPPTAVAPAVSTTVTERTHRGQTGKPPPPAGASPPADKDIIKGQRGTTFDKDPYQLIMAHYLLTMPTVVRLASYLIVFAALLSAAPAHGQDAKAEAKKHFQRGLELVGENDYAAAVIEFERAYEKSPHFAVLYNLGQAYLAQGRPVEAVDILKRYLTEGGTKIPSARKKQVEVEIARQSARIATLSLEVSPPGVSVKIDGREVGKSPFPSPIRVGVGEHTIVASLDGYRSSESKLALAGEESKSLAVSLEKLPEQKPTEILVPAKQAPPAQIAISCPLRGVSVFLDERRIGQTPFVASLVTIAGPHSLHFERAGYRPSTIKLDVPANETGKASCTLVPLSPLPEEAAGRLEVTASEPGAEIFLDGEAISSPSRLPVGPHTLEVRRVGFQPWSREISIPPGRTLSEPALLIPTPGYLHDYEARTRSRRSFSYVVGLSGAAVGLLAGGLYLWNDGRYDTWQKERDALDSEWTTQKPPFPTSLGERQKQNDSLISSVQSADKVVVGVGVASAALLLTGVVLYLTGDDPERYSHLGIKESGRRAVPQGLGFSW